MNYQRAIITWWTTRQLLLRQWWTREHRPLSAGQQLLLSRGEPEHSNHCVIDNERTPTIVSLRTAIAVRGEPENSNRCMMDNERTPTTRCSGKPKRQQLTAKLLLSAAKSGRASSSCASVLSLPHPLCDSSFWPNEADTVPDAVCEDASGVFPVVVASTLIHLALIVTQSLCFQTVNAAFGAECQELVWDFFFFLYVN